MTNTINFQYEGIQALAQKIINEADWSPLVNAIVAAVGTPPPPDPDPIDPVLPWSPEDWAESVAWAFRDTDLAVGPVSQWQSIGMKPKSGTGLANRLTEGGVLFAKGSGDKFQWAVDSDSHLLHRMWVVIVKADLANSGGADNIPVLTVHGPEGGNNHRQPAIFFNGATSELICSVYDSLGHKNIKAPAVEGWNVLVGWRNGWKHHAWINGVKAVLPLNAWVQNTEAKPSWIGANNIVTTMPCDVTVKRIYMMQGEHSDDFAQAIIGWACHLAGRLGMLDAAHPYKTNPPQPSDIVLPALFEHDLAAWDAWAATTGAEKGVNRGNPPPAPVGYSTIFFDDFTANTIADDQNGGEGEIWYAPTHVPGICVDAVALRPGQSPSVYIHDPVNHTLTLRMMESVPGNGQWRSGAFSSVNKNGQGTTFPGLNSRYMIRCKFPQLSPPRPGFFPAFWGYDAQHLFWRTRNRIEHDYMEYDGLNGAWINTSLHSHNPPIASAILGVNQTNKFDKIAGLELIPANGFDPAVDIYDGQFHVWEFRTEEDFTYIIVDDKEVSRVPTTIAELTVPRYIIVDWALRKNQGQPVAGQVYDMTIDWIRVEAK